MKILIAIPCMDKIDTTFVRCLMALKSPCEYRVSFMQSSLIYDARNNLCLQAIEGGFDYVLWLDSDMVFDADLLERMLESIGDDDFLTALCFRRKMPYKPCIYDVCEYQKGENGNTIPVTHTFDEIPNEKAEVQACGFACVLMKTDIIRKLAANRELFFSPIIGFGEDFSFCIRARKIGIKLLCDPNISIGHLAQMAITREIYESVREENAKSS